MSIRRIVFALALLMSCVSLQAQPLVEGNEYRSLEPIQHTDAPGKIVVIEFFSYGCPHCNEFYPMISAWAAKLPKDVVVEKVATGMGRTAWTNLAKAYYALAATGDLSRLDGQLFHAIHEEHQPLFDQKAISAWVVAHGVDAAKFTAAFESFGVSTKLTQAEQMVDNYKIDGVPSLAVDGKYVVIGKTFEQLLANTDALIAKVRTEHATARK